MLILYSIKDKIIRLHKISFIKDKKERMNAILRQDYLEKIERYLGKPRNLKSKHQKGGSEWRPPLGVYVVERAKVGD